MKYLAIALVLAGVAQAHAADINFGEMKTRFQLRDELAGGQRLRPWEFDWRHPYAWQHGNSRRTEFAPRGCYIRRVVTTPSARQWQELFIC
jgi:hypothetical protein